MKKLIFISSALAIAAIFYISVLNLKNNPVAVYEIKPTPTKDYNWSGHGVDPDVTPLQSKNGFLRYSEYDALSQRPIREGGRKDVVIHITEADYNKVFPDDVQIYGVQYLASGTKYQDQIKEIKISNPTETEIYEKFKEYNGDLEFVIRDENVSPNNISKVNFNKEKYNTAVSMFINKGLILKFLEDYPDGLASINFRENEWKIFDVLAIRLNNDNKVAQKRKYTQFINNLKLGNYFMFWRNYRALPEFLYSDLGPGSTLVLNSISRAYIAQSKGLIPAYLICGYQELKQDNGKIIHYDACGVTEAIDYGDN